MYGETMTALALLPVSNAKAWKGAVIGGPTVANSATVSQPLVAFLDP